MIRLRRAFAGPVATIRARADAWARARQGVDRNPAALNSRRIYILPTRLGIVYALTVFSMLLGSMNYNNSMGFVLTFFLVALGLVAMHHCHRNLSGLVVGNAGAESVFAGNNASFRIAFSNPSASDRFELCVFINDVESERIDLANGETGTSQINIETRRRGLLRIHRYGVSSDYPFGLFRAWAWVYSELRCTVWPAPADNAGEPPLARVERGNQNDNTAGNDDFAGLRDFHAGDSPRRIAWKVFARSQELKTKQFSGTTSSNAWLDVAQTPGRNLEDRLAILSRWILDAEQRGSSYALKLGATQIRPASGTLHMHRCLDALATYGLED